MTHSCVGLMLAQLTRRHGATAFALPMANYRHLCISRMTNRVPRRRRSYNEGRLFVGVIGFAAPKL
jgi:hypothetical protein